MKTNLTQSLFEAVERSSNRDKSILPVQQNLKFEQKKINWLLHEISPNNYLQTASKITNYDNDPTWA